MRPAQAPEAYSERVTVLEPSPDGLTGGPDAGARLARADLQALGGAGTVDDPLRAVQAMPFAVAGDDFRSELSVRGSQYRQTAVTIDGVRTRWIQHALRGIGDAVSLGMLNSLVMDQASLRAGVYPRRVEGTLGPQVDFILRDGSRAGRCWQGLVGPTHMATTGEGPLGAARRGSWLMAVRQSYREWPNTLMTDLIGKAFGFSDAQARLVYDVASSQQVSATAVFGRSVVDERGPGAPSDLAVASNRAALATVGLRSTLTAGTVASQRLSIATHDFRDTSQAHQELSGGLDDEVAYSSSLTQAVGPAIVDGGVQVDRVHSGRSTARGAMPFMQVPSDLPGDQSLAGTSWVRSGYVHLRWAPAPRLTLAPGLRIDDSSLLARRAVSRWVLSELALPRNWSVTASAGNFRQLPDIEQALAGGGPATRLKPERAAEVDIAIEQRFSSGSRWRATMFRRDERDILREPEAAPGIDVRGMPGGSFDMRYENRLAGAAHGLEVLVQRSNRAGFSGWAAYAYGRSRAADPNRGEVYWADFDQRHGVNASAIYRFSDRTLAALKFRGGSNFPVPGYLSRRDGRLVIGDHRNEVRLPPYARLDVRTSHTFYRGGHRLTIFADVVNVLNRRNVGLASGTFDAARGSADGLTRAQFPRLPSLGLLVQF